MNEQQITKLANAFLVVAVVLAISIIAWIAITVNNSFAIEACGNTNVTVQEDGAILCN